ncbi:hypothetical protein BT69DRAFT_1291712 [Atractiella rhizophila]|nr:hypothetical protein BT69DRAFT_1291712 [Atractiella rhizophila]
MTSTKSIRQIKLVDMVKRNNEDGTAFSEAERKKREREVDLTIPGYEELEVLMLYLGFIKTFFVQFWFSTRSPKPQSSLGRLYQKLLLLVKNKTDIPQEDVDKARGHIPITDSDKKRVKLQASSIDKLMNRMADEYKRQAFDQQIFDDLLLKYNWKFPISKEQAIPVPQDGSIPGEDDSVAGVKQSWKLRREERSQTAKL